MKTKIVLALCALAVALCLVGCTAKAGLAGTAWKSSSVAFAEEQAGVKGATYTATAFFMKNGVLCLELYMPKFSWASGGKTFVFPDTTTSTGTWTASNVYEVSFDITADYGSTTNIKGTFPLKIVGDKMEFLNGDGSVNTTWERVVK